MSNCTDYNFKYILYGIIQLILLLLIVLLILALIFLYFKQKIFGVKYCPAYIVKSGW